MKEITLTLKWYVLTYRFLNINNQYINPIINYENFKILAVRAMVLTGIVLGSVFYSCQSEDVEIQSSASENKFIEKTGGPVTMTFSAAAKLLSMNEAADCFTVEVNIIVYIPGQGSSIWSTFITTGGPGCPGIISSPGAPGSPGTMPGGKPAVSNYNYNGDWFEDAEVGGKASDLFNKYPDAYSEYVTARNNVIVTNGGTGY